MTEKKILKAGNMDSSIISRGFTNWKDASGIFRKHEASECHRAAVEAIVVLPLMTKDVGEALSEEHKKEKVENQTMLLKIISTIRFLCRQGLPVPGHDGGMDSNFMQTLKWQSENDRMLALWLEKKKDKYTSPQIQNQLIKIMALRILRSVVSAIKVVPFFTIMADETTDCTNKEQLVLMIRWVDQDLMVHEDFIGLHQVDSIEAKVIYAAIEDMLLRIDLPMHKIRGQCFDGASNMSGKRNGVAKLITDKEPKALYTHCYGHSLNLAVMDSVKGSPLMKRALDCTHEITKLIKFSPRRDVLFEKIKGELAPQSPGVRVLCPTRWTVRADALACVVVNFAALQELWIEAVSIVNDTETIGRLNGVAAVMEQFDFLFGVMLGELLLKHSDNLSKTLQKQSLSAAEGQECAHITVKTLQSLRSDNMFELFWNKVTMTAKNHDLNSPTLPRRRKTPKRFETGTAAAEFPVSPRDYFRVQYFEAIDLVINSIQERFNQPGFAVYRNLQDLLTNAAAGKEYTTEYEFIKSFYVEDIDPLRLSSQLSLLQTHFSTQEGTHSYLDVIRFLSSLSPSRKEFFHS